MTVHILGYFGEDGFFPLTFESFSCILLFFLPTQFSIWFLVSYHPSMLTFFSFITFLLPSTTSHSVYVNISPNKPNMIFMFSPLNVSSFSLNESENSKKRGYYNKPIKRSQSLHHHSASNLNSNSVIYANIKIDFFRLFSHTMNLNFLKRKIGFFLN